MMRLLTLGLVLAACPVFSGAVEAHDRHAKVAAFRQATAPPSRGSKQSKLDFAAIPIAQSAGDGGRPGATSYHSNFVSSASYTFNYQPKEAPCCGSRLGAASARPRRLKLTSAGFLRRHSSPRRHSPGV
jgi:hypothetical protein